MLGEIAPNNQTLRTGSWKIRPSPTPSLKKKKAEAILKEHGSPPGVRVTAGGRIVPSEQSPLCHPRYGYSAIKTNGGLIKFSPNHPVGNPQWSSATQNGFVAQDVNGRLCQIVDGTIMPLNEVDGALRLFMAAPNLNIMQRNSSVGGIPAAPRGMSRDRIVSGPQPLSAPSVPAQTQALEREYTKLDRDLKELDKAEVLYRDTMGKEAQAQLFQNRRNIVTALDKVRRALKSIKQSPPPTAPTQPRAMAHRTAQDNAHTRYSSAGATRAESFQSMPPPVLPYYNQHAQPDFPAAFGFGPFVDPAAAYSSRSFSMPPPGMFVPPSYDPAMAATVPSFETSAAMPTSLQQYQEAPSAAPPVTPPHGRADSAFLGEVLAAASFIPQHDGTRSFADLKISPPRQSHALPIKAPEPKRTAAVKSILNPMSPAYKPGSSISMDQSDVTDRVPRSVKDRVPTPLPSLDPGRVRDDVVDFGYEHAIDSPSKQLQEELRRSQSRDDHRASVSSFATVDFFPRNTREYSTNKHKYPEVLDDSEDKENEPPRLAHSSDDGNPDTPEKESHNSNWNPTIPARAFDIASPSSADRKAPGPPPGTPVTHSKKSSDEPQPIRFNDVGWERQSHGNVSLPDRSAHNISPKAKRQDWLFVEETAERIATHPSSPAQTRVSASGRGSRLDSSTGDGEEVIDFTQKSREFLEGYRAGLARKAVGNDKVGDFMDGYCSGLLKSAPTTRIGSSTGSPTKQISRRPSPVLSSRPSSRLQVDRRDPVFGRPPLETSTQSLDTFKQAVFAPQNENAILTPAIDGPNVNEMPFNLGSYGRSRQERTTTDSLYEKLAMGRGDGNAGFPFPPRTSSVAQNQLSEVAFADMGRKSSAAEKSTAVQLSGESSQMLLPKAPLTGQHTGNQIPVSDTHAHPAAKRRVFSLNAAPSSELEGNELRRVTSSQSSNLYRHYPGHRVFSPHLEYKSASSIAQVGGLASGFFSQYDGAPETISAEPSFHSALTNVSGIAGAQQQGAAAAAASSEKSPQRSRFQEQSVDGPNSPPMSPGRSRVTSPSRSSPGKKESPSKGSPARSKIEAIAGKVGIKAKKDDEHDSSPEKPRWRDIWRRSNRKDDKDG